MLRYLGVVRVQFDGHHPMSRLVQARCQQATYFTQATDHGMAPKKAHPHHRRLLMKDRQDRLGGGVGDKKGGKKAGHFQRPGNGVPEVTDLQREELQGCVQNVREPIRDAMRGEIRAESAKPQPDCQSGQSTDQPPFGLLVNSPQGTCNLLRDPGKV
jgi:hypothetical protein